MAKIQLNGRKITIKSKFSILDLLKKYKLYKKNIAVEYNGTIVQKTNFRDNDTIAFYCNLLIAQFVFV